MSGGDGGRTLSLRKLLPQAAVAGLVVVVALGWGRYAGWSALGGATVAWVTTLYMWSRALVAERSVGAALRRAMVGELIKVSATIALFAVAARVPHLVWPALLGGYAAGLVSCWLSSATPAGGTGADGSGARARAQVTSELGL